MQIYIFIDTVKEIETKQECLLPFINNSIGHSIELAIKWQRILSLPPNAKSN